MTTIGTHRDVRPGWHALTPADVCAALDTTERGLSSGDARTRLEVAGPNAVPRAPSASAWRVLAAQFRSVVILLLAGAAVVSAATADLADTFAISAVLALNIAIGFAIEIRAHRAVEALSRLEARYATVLRDGLPVEIDARDVVPGDVLLLDQGQSVPADGRVFASTELRTVEGTLTGESLPVSKHAAAAVDTHGPMSERRNMVYAGTIIASGSGRAVVTATGGNTELGNIGRLVSATAVEPTPLERKLDTLGRQLVLVALVVGAITSVLAWWQNAAAAVVLQAGIALAVAAVPEGLPAVATITLALGVHRMAQRRALVRRLPAVETLGAVTVLCTDKTGTLTAGAMTVTEVRTTSRAYRVTGSAYEPSGEFVYDGMVTSLRSDLDLLRALEIATAVNRADAILTDSGWVPRGDPTEAALVVAARKGGIERASVLHRLPEIGEVPFSSERKLMATFHRGVTDEALTVFVKGSPQKILDLCARTRVDGHETALSAEARASLLEANHGMAERGLRVLGVAYGHVDRAEESALRDLTFVALIGMNDPPAPGVREAIRAFRGAGIATVMITGDQAGTARAVARDLGLGDTLAALDGRAVDAMSEAELQECLPKVTVFSRISPEAKLRIVAAYQRRGEIVAMIGDGVNDAAALKKADVGVTMGGRGTDVARETAAVVLEDDRFETIGVAIEEGRVVFDNIRKFVFYLFSCNLAEVFVLLGTGAIGLPLPLAPIQVLWLNLVTDTVPALALALEPGEPGVMRRPPRDPALAILSSEFVRRIAGYAVLIAGSTLAVVAWGHLAGVAPQRAMTMTFMTLAFAQVFHLGNARGEDAVVAPGRVVANPAALAAVAIVIALQLLAVYAQPLADLLALAPLSWSEWALVTAASAFPAVVGQAFKATAKSARATERCLP